MTKTALTEISFGTVTVQRMRRIALDGNLLRALGICEGDSIEVVLLVDTSEIVLRSKKIPKIAEAEHIKQ